MLRVKSALSRFGSQRYLASSKRLVQCSPRPIRSFEALSFNMRAYSHFSDLAESGEAFETIESARAASRLSPRFGPIRRGPFGVSAVVQQGKQTPQKPTPGARISPISWPSLALLIALGTAAIGYFNYTREQQKKKAQRRVTTTGDAKIGGPFELVDSDGIPMTDHDLRGQFYIVYFGFTYCPDICPNELVKLGKIVDLVSNQNPSLPPIVPVFITVDPHRDTVEQMRAYRQDFHPTMLALTGTPQQISRVTKSFRVYFSDTMHRDEDDEDYIVDHSIALYLMGPDGKFMDFYPQLTEPEEAAADIGLKMRERLSQEGIEVGGEGVLDGISKAIAKFLG